jgi:preprotein translocase subunit Sec63
MPTSEAAVTNISVAIAIGLWYVAQSHVSVLLQVAIVLAIGLVLPATYRRVTAPIPERTDEPTASFAD